MIIHAYIEAGKSVHQLQRILEAGEKIHTHEHRIWVGGVRASAERT